MEIKTNSQKNATVPHENERDGNKDQFTKNGLSIRTQDIHTFGCFSPDNYRTPCLPLIKSTMNY